LLTFAVVQINHLFKPDQRVEWFFKTAAKLPPSSFAIGFYRMMRPVIGEKWLTATSVLLGVTETGFVTRFR
jgi:hypothetical protein